MAKKSKVITVGYANTRKALEVPDSPDGFEWPSFRGHREATSEQRVALRGALRQLMEYRGLDHSQFAGEFLGESRDGNGNMARTGMGQVRKWLDGEGWPTPIMARKLASYFKVPMARLLQYDGPAPKKIYLRVPGGAKKRRANGHGGNGLDTRHAAVVARGGHLLTPVTPELPPPRVKPPKGAKPVQVKIETVPNDASWCHVNVAGTLPLDVGLGLLAYIERHKAHGG